MTTAPATSADAAPADAEPEQRVLQRLILPLEATPDIIPLYIEQQTARSGSVDSSFGLGDADAPQTSAPSASGGQSGSQVDVSELSHRHSVKIPAHQMRSFGTYFNAFPASYWRRWTPVRSVRLSIRTSGRGQIVVYRSNARGSIQRQDFAMVSGDTESVFELPLTAFGDGGWYWFDVYAGAKTFTVAGAEWTTDAALARTRGTFSISMTTMNKVEYCLENIRTLESNPDLRSVLDVMYVIDQGSDRLGDHPGELGELQESLGAQLQIIEQGNIGGSGGFSRGMYETVQAGTSTYVVNCDDDIVIEPESLLRLVTFADYATTPTIAGAHMFDLNNRSVLHTFGEVVDPWRIQPALPHEDNSLGHDFAQHPLRSTPWLHRRADVDYNGWWMCLIPVEAVREIGLSLPVFIKWDDAEYGLRAKKAGYHTVSLPGAGVWHVSWVDKDDLVGWQAYFHERNRIITALLHSPYARGGRVVRESQYMDVKHLISMQYYTEAGRLLAQQDALRGPAPLHAEIGTKLPEIRAMAAGYDDSQAKKDAGDFPEIHVDKPPHRGRPYVEPRRTRLPAWTAKTLVTQLVRPVKERAERNPQTAIAHQDARWWRLSQYDSALVSNAEGTQVSWYKRDPQRVRDMLAAAARTHAELFRRWPELQQEYRDAAKELTSFEAWARTFRENPAPARPGRDDAGASAPADGGATTA